MVLKFTALLEEAEAKATPLRCFHWERYGDTVAEAREHEERIQAELVTLWQGLEPLLPEVWARLDPAQRKRVHNLAGELRNHKLLNPVVPSTKPLALPPHPLARASVYEAWQLLPTLDLGLPGVAELLARRPERLAPVLPHPRKRWLARLPGPLADLRAEGDYSVMRTLDGRLHVFHRNQCQATEDLAGLPDELWALVAGKLGGDPRLILVSDDRLDCRKVPSLKALGKVSWKQPIRRVQAVPGEPYFTVIGDDQVWFLRSDEKAPYLVGKAPGTLVDFLPGGLAMVESVLYDYRQGKPVPLGSKSAAPSPRQELATCLGSGLRVLAQGDQVLLADDRHLAAHSLYDLTQPPTWKRVTEVAGLVLDGQCEEGWKRLWHFPHQVLQFQAGL